MPLDDLEVALELPPGHGLLELPALPVAGADVVVDELLAEELSRLLRLRELLRRRAERAGEGLRLRVVAVPRSLRRQGELLFDAVEAGGDRGGHRDVRVHVGRGEAVFDAGRG